MSVNNCEASRYSLEMRELSSDIPEDPRRCIFYAFLTMLNIYSLSRQISRQSSPALNKPYDEPGSPGRGKILRHRAIVRPRYGRYLSTLRRHFLLCSNGRFGITEKTPKYPVWPYRVTNHDPFAEYIPFPPINTGSIRNNI